MIKKPVVLFLPKWYPDKFDAFDGNFIENHAIAVNKLCNVAVLYAHSDAELKKRYELIETNQFGFPEIRVYFKKSACFFSPLALLINSIRYIFALFKAYRHYLRNYPAPNLCHVNVLARPSLLALYLKWFKKVPYIITEHWSGYHPISGAYKGAFKKLLTRIAVKNAAALTVVSNNLMQSMQSHGLKGNYSIIPNVVDTSIFQPLNTKSEQDTFRFIHISNLSTVPKNMPLIVDALNLLIAEGYVFEFCLVGTGAEEQKTLEKINASPLGKFTQFKGELPMEKVAEEMRKSDVLLLFSRFENQPCVILEAFASGIPVISSAVGGIPDIVNENLGVLVPPNDIHQFAAAIRNFLNRKNSFSKAHIRLHAEENYSQAVIGKKFLQLYQTVLKEV